MKLKNYTQLILITVISLMSVTLVADHNQKEVCATGQCHDTGHHHHHRKHNPHACHNGTMHCPVLDRCVKREECHKAPHYYDLTVEHYIKDRR